MPTLFRQTRPFPLPPDAEIVDKDGKPHARINSGKRYELYPLTEDGKRYLKPSPVWCAMAREADGKRKPVRLSRDKDAAAVLLAKLLKGIEDTKAGIRPPTATQQVRPLSALLAEYRQCHADQGNTPEQTTLTVRRCELTFAECRFVTLTNVDAAVVDRWLAEQRGRRRGSARRPAITTSPP